VMKIERHTHLDCRRAEKSTNPNSTHGRFS
jgi:hypothetical protein